jgi:hypothetical protein
MRADHNSPHFTKAGTPRLSRITQATHFETGSARDLHGGTAPAASAENRNGFRLHAFSHRTGSQMPRYYFDLKDRNGLFPDEEGLDLRDLDAAQEEAAQSLSEMVRDAARTPTRDPIQRMAVEVRDETGPVMHVRFSFEIERKN